MYQGELATTRTSTDDLAEMIADLLIDAMTGEVSVTFAEARIRKLVRKINRAARRG